MTRRALSIFAVALLVAAGTLVWVRAQDVVIDRQKAEALQKRMLKGETLTPEEKATILALEPTTHACDTPFLTGNGQAVLCGNSTYSARDKRLSAVWLAYPLATPTRPRILGSVQEPQNVSAFDGSISVDWTNPSGTEIIANAPASWSVRTAPFFVATKQAQVNSERINPPIARHGANTWVTVWCQDIGDSFLVKEAGFPRSCRGRNELKLGSDDG